MRVRVRVRVTDLILVRVRRGVRLGASVPVGGWHSLKPGVMLCDAEGKQ